MLHLKSYSYLQPPVVSLIIPSNEISKLTETVSQFDFRGKSVEKLAARGRPMLVTKGSLRTEGTKGAGFGAVVD